MLDRTGDVSGQRWHGRVVNVMDPKKQGRIQVRIFGLHDNQSLIPDSELPWASVVMPINSGASYRGVGGSPVGVIPGTIVEGYFADRERTILRATGVSPSAGRTKTGETIDGSYALDSAYNDAANAARGQDLNAALGLKNFPAISQIGAVFPAVSAGIGSLATHTGDILGLMASVDPNNMSGAMANAITGMAKSQGLYQLTSLARTVTGGMDGIATALQAVESGIITVQSLPSQLQALVQSYPGGIPSLISLATSLGGSNPVGLLNAATGGLLNQALGIASVVGGGFSGIVNQLTSALALTTKQREFALQAASPTPPPTPEPPTTTTSKASTKPAAKASTDPWAQTETYDILPVAVNANQVDDNLKTVTSEEILGKTVQTEQVNSEVENENIMKQIGQNSETQQAAAADVRSMNESKLSPKEKAAAVREMKRSGGVI